MAINFACIPIILLFYPETKGVSLEDMGYLFHSDNNNNNNNNNQGRLPGPLSTCFRNTHDSDNEEQEEDQEAGGNTEPANRFITAITKPFPENGR
ncbi:hypothetical protein F5Y08DRAFT_344615 [Xylaria arbuscula]|nr:hypothetical protein F5Y08DRAFT_344615 [Xylaria arbuscula]